MADAGVWPRLGWIGESYFGRREVGGGVGLGVMSESGGGGRVKRSLYSDKLSGDKEIVIRGCGRGVVERGQLPLEEPES